MNQSIEGNREKKMGRSKISSDFYCNPLKPSLLNNIYDYNKLSEMNDSPNKLPSYDPAIADYIPMVYVAIAFAIGTFIAVRLYLRSKKKTSLKKTVLDH